MLPPFSAEDFAADWADRLAEFEPRHDELPDPFDRVTLATARADGMPLVSPDTALRDLRSQPAVW